MKMPPMVGYGYFLESPNHLASEWFPSDLHYNIRPKQELEWTKVDESSNSLRAQNSQ